MTAFDDILKSVQLGQRFSNPTDLGGQMAEIIKSQSYTTKQLGGFNMLAEFAKSMKHQNIFVNPPISAIESMKGSIATQQQFSISQTAIDSLISINTQHQQFFGAIKALTDSLSIQSPAIAQINNLHFAINDIAGQVAVFAVKRKNWNLIDDFEQVTEQAIDFTETLSQETTEEQKRQFQVLLRIVFAFLKKHKTVGIASLIVIDIFIRIADLHQYYDFLQERPELATKEDFNKISIKQDSAAYFIRQINEQLKQEKEYKITNRKCEVKLKPKLKTLTLCQLPSEFDVIVIQIHHKWVYVSYFDPTDNLPQTGWIMKKYLDSPE